MKACTTIQLSQQEHLCLQRHLAVLQARVSEQMATLAEAQALAEARAATAECRCHALERALIRERARAVLACTRWSWGLGGPPPHDLPAPRGTSADQTPLVSATEVLCQTGCQGHAHPWLDADGACRLTGGECTRVGAPARVVAGEDEHARD